MDAVHASKSDTLNGDFLRNFQQGNNHEVLSVILPIETQWTIFIAIISVSE